MSNYRRARVPGGSFFFTVALAERRSSLLIDRIDDLRAAFRAAQAKLGPKGTEVINQSLCTAFPWV
ncbi:hypothetical protein [Lysobacter sp. CFH 32150]|uniref:hypothetical protein n=1 Tax=Lysobacter sp. CFH 32150 TaxID=2927128 RepID=UPI001FA7A678|nr:hypothetical protein [Lysobacter sp. CFH 32150]MCI4567112.1 hypothetical protein [Lysobacter sp. CFH 32150]